MRLKHQVSVDRSYHKQVASGQKIMTDRQDSGLSTPLQNSPEFASGWREKKLARMTAAEVDRLFEEYTLLVKVGGAEN